MTLQNYEVILEENRRFTLVVEAKNQIEAQDIAEHLYYDDALYEKVETWMDGSSDGPEVKRVSRIEDTNGWDVLTYDETATVREEMVIEQMMNLIHKGNMMDGLSFISVRNRVKRLLEELQEATAKEVE